MSGPSGLQALLSIALGLGLAAACGFRVFVPLLIASATARFGHLHLAGGFDWLASTGALIALASATALEIVAYYVPWLDHALDMIATPAAVLAGMFASASVLVDLPPATQVGHYHHRRRRDRGAHSGNLSPPPPQVHLAHRRSGESRGCDCRIDGRGRRGPPRSTPAAGRSRLGQRAGVLLLPGDREAAVWEGC